MSQFKSINPKNGKLMKTFESATSADIKAAITKAHNSYKYMRNNGNDGL